MMKPLGYLMLSVFLIVMDQLSKWGVSEIFLRPAAGLGMPMDPLPWLMQAPERLPYAQIEITPFLNLVMVWNKGISFGLFNHDIDNGPLLLIILSFVISFWFLVWLFRTQIPAQMFGIALVIGGALGNVIDRFRFGAVIDFLDFHIAGLHWPAFNLADSCIVLGVIVLIGHSIFFEKDLQKDLQNDL